MDAYTGQVGLIRFADKWSGGWWIQKVTRSDAYHVVVFLDQHRCVSADPAGVVVCDPARYGQRLTVSRFPLTTAQAHDIVNTAKTCVGKPYAFIDDGILGISALTGVRVPRVLRWWLSKPWAYMCSELSSKALAAAGISVRPDREPCETTPKDYETYFRTEGWI